MTSFRYICAAVSSVVLFFGGIAFADTEKPGDNPRVMFVQSAPGVSLKDGKLTLMSPSTIFFSGQPERMAGHMPCHKFIQAWSDGDDSFRKSPPVATLTAFGSNGTPMKMDVTLQNPRFEGANLVYDANVVNGRAPEGMHEAALFMNDPRLLKVYYRDVLPDGTVTGPLAPDAHGG
jgi:hypothetical protein